MASKRPCGPCRGTGKQEKHTYAQVQLSDDPLDTREVLVKSEERCWRCRGEGEV